MVFWIWIGLGLPSIISFVGILTWFISEWIWKPWRLIQACQKQGITGFPFFPFVGQLPQISKALNTLENKIGNDWEALRSAMSCVEEHGKVFYFTTGKTVRLCIADPGLFKDLLATNADSYAKPSFIHVLDILGDGLFRSSGKVWTPQRQLLGLSFAVKEIKAEVGLITNCARATLDKWKLEVTSKSTEMYIHQRMLELTLNVIKTLAFGAENASKENSAKPVTNTFDRYLLNSRELVFGTAASVPGYRFLPTNTNREISKDRTWLMSAVEELIQARSKATASSAPEKRNHRDVLDLLMDAVQGDAAQQINRHQLRDNSVTILLAGHHTTASLLTWTMYMLALHPLWQERARAEVEEFYLDRTVDWSTLSHLKTITMILQEILRLFPPIPLIGRSCLTENTLGPYMIPAGIEILIPTAVIHRDKDLWGEDADQFVPMRFANGIGKACKHKMGYLPFGYGPRTCIGQTLALTEAKAVLAEILPLFDWRLGPGYRHCPDISLTLKPKFDVPIIMEKL